MQYNIQLKIYKLFDLMITAKSTFCDPITRFAYISDFYINLSCVGCLSLKAFCDANRGYFTLAWQTLRYSNSTDSR